MEADRSVPVDLIRQAQSVLARYHISRSPLIKLNVPDTPGKTIYLKCENLLPFGSFKARGACFAVDQLPRERIQDGVCGASAGNFAQGLGYMAKQYGVPCTMLVPDYAPQTKLLKMRELGVQVKPVPFSDWWAALLSHRADGFDDLPFIHPCDETVIAGHGTIGLEILDALPDVDCVVSPYGSGGLITGIASALKPLKPDVRVIACEPETACPLSLSLKAGHATTCTNHTQSFVDGMGGKQVLDEMWPYVSHLVDGCTVVTLRQICDSIKLLVERNSLVAEGAGAATLAAALADDSITGNVVCVISGGNIDSTKLCTILNGGIPD